MNENEIRELDKYFMKAAIEEASDSYRTGEVPVGAVIVKNNKIISASSNSVEKDLSSVMHAEIKAIMSAQKILNSWRLSGCTLYVTLEPCLMCCGAIILSRMDKVIYAADDPKTGAVNSLYNTLSDKRLNHNPEIISGILKEESSALLKKFFQAKRNKENRN
ncbi:MAG: nucleoside deaminase [Candidatus Acididesulfobacter guangdongensis]|uniref:tRNA-specific adenosine deaminase n=1 Tax=Acididesulfobacter guangdongensis TaxID=2597225 RepID=A0A519BGS3_ACIG2|nr:MAG: nucleoside deaminase [Candidatus Acididesulfobacter guangdongensis]